LELDLTSSERTIVLGSDVFDGSSSYTVKTGNEDRVVTAGSQVSAAEFVALQQVIADGKQDLILDANGRGIDGQFSIDSIASGGTSIHAKSLVVPSSVDATGNLSRSSDFRLTGDLVNNGNVHLTDKANGSSIAARVIVNNSGATVSSLGDLNLSASRDLLNDGSIASEGKITLSAGNRISNAGSIAAQTDLNFMSPRIRNSGILSSQQNISFDTASASSIIIDSVGGRISTAGDINVRTANFTAKVDTTFTGGEWLSDSVNIYSGEGHINVEVDDITGGVIAHAGTALIQSSGELLTIQELVTTGDPLIMNSGHVTLNSQTTNGNPLTVIAGRNIFLQSSTINTSSTTGDGGDILMIAGANFSVVGSVLQVHGASGTGGNITGVEPFISSSSTVGDGGNITLAAFSGSPGTGQIELTESLAQIRTLGAIGENNGDVTVIAPERIRVFNVRANGAGTIVAGNVLISASQPLVSGPFQVNTNTGAVLSGSIMPGVEAGHLSLGFTEAGVVSLSGRSVNAGNITATAGIELTAINQITGGPLFTPSLTINLPAEGLASLHEPTNNIGSLIGTGGGTIKIANSTDLLISGLASTQSLVATSLGTITIGVDISTTGDTTFNTTELVNNHTVIANSVRVFSPSESMVVDGGSGGAFTATGVDKKVVIGSWLGGITLQGNLTFGSEAEVTVSSSPSPVTIASGATVLGQDVLTINADNVNLSGSISASTLVINYDLICGTIANSQGDIVLTGPVIMNGGNLAILATGNITATGPLTINSSSSSGDAGSVFLWAGVYLDPATPGQITDSFTTFNFGTGGSGNVLLADVDINVSSTNGRGGDVVVAASGGSISLGEIDASGTTSGGNIQLYGKNGVTVGDIIATGTTGGSVIVETAELVLQAPNLQVFNGTVSGNIFPYSTSLETGLLSLEGINVGNGSLFVRGPEISIGGPIVANDVTLFARETLDLTALTGGIALTQDSAGNGGSLAIEARDMSFTSDTSNPFVLRADGSGTGNGGSIYLYESDKTNTYIGNVSKAKSGSQFLEVFANSGESGGNGGSISIRTLGDLIVDPTKVSASPLGAGVAGGGHYSLSAGDGVADIPAELIVLGDLRADGVSGGAGGRITLSTSSKTPFVLNTKSTKNGVTGILAASGPGGRVDVFNTIGDVLVKTQEALQASVLGIYSDGVNNKKSSVRTGKNVVITADEVTLSVGALSSSNKFIKVSTEFLSAYGAIGKIESVGTNPLELFAQISNNDFELISHSSIEIQKISSYLSDIEVVCTNGSIRLLENPINPGFISANSGNITIQNTDIVNGAITLGENTKIFTALDGGDITLAIGDIVKKGKNTQAPSNVFISVAGSGSAYFEPGPSVVDAQGAPSFVTVENHDVILSSTSAQKIVFEGNNQIIAETTAFPAPALMTATGLQRTAIRADQSITNVELPSATAVPKGSMTFVDSVHINDLESILSLPKRTAIGQTDIVSTRDVAWSATDQTKFSLPTQYTACNTTDAYVWSDDELGLDQNYCLKKRTNTFGTHPDAFAEVACLRRGVVLMTPSKETKLETPLATVEIGAGAMALVVVNDSKLAVYDLHDDHKGTVRVSSKSKTTTLSPGRCIMLTDKHQHSFDHINPINSIGYKSITTHNHGNELKLFGAEFSTISAINSIKPLRALLTSKQTAARLLSSKLIKTSAVLMHLSNNEEFKQYSQATFVARGN